MANASYDERTKLAQILFEETFPFLDESDENIAKKLRELKVKVCKSHPDKGGNDETFKSLNKVSEILNNPKYRHMVKDNVLFVMKQVLTNIEQWILHDKTVEAAAMHKREEEEAIKKAAAAKINAAKAAEAAKVNAAKAKIDEEMAKLKAADKPKPATAATAAPSAAAATEETEEPKKPQDWYETLLEYEAAKAAAEAKAAPTSAEDDPTLAEAAKTHKTHKKPTPTPSRPASFAGAAAAPAAPAATAAPAQAATSAPKKCPNGGRCNKSGCEQGVHPVNWNPDVNCIPCKFGVECRHFNSIWGCSFGHAGHQKINLEEYESEYEEEVFDNKYKTVICIHGNNCHYHNDRGCNFLHKGDQGYAEAKAAKNF
jgi:hypothetical protein